MSLILAIESSCDDSSVALLQGYRLLGMKQSGQEEHRRYGGVVPELASRAHQEWLSWMVNDLMRDTSTSWSDIQVIAYTRGPGLMGALMVGAALAKGLSLSLEIPLIGVNHLHGHLVSHFVEHEPQGGIFPMLSLTVSGGHTHLVWMDSWLHGRTLCETLDDAAGEAFDKCAKMLGLPYPGGSVLDRLSSAGNPAAYAWPTPQLGNESYSFSGLKTSVLYYLAKHKPDLTDCPDSALYDLSASIQANIVEALMKPVVHYADRLKPQCLGLAGGVAANSLLRSRMLALGYRLGCAVHIPPLALCTDNAAMIAASARILMEHGVVYREALGERPLPRWPLMEYLEEVSQINLSPKGGS
jgi:N6-L-threonylcarbamoyladenine synthase